MINFLARVLTYIGHRTPLFFPRLSFSQNGEDLVIIDYIGLKEVKDYFFVDIGSNHPIRLSNSFKLDWLGMSGYAYEPNRSYAFSYNIVRPNTLLFPTAVTSDGGNVAYHEFDVDSLNTCDKSKKEFLESVGHKCLNVKQFESISIDEVVERVSKTIGSRKLILLIDVESQDYELLEAYDWNLLRPRICCVETLSYTTDNRGEKLAAFDNLFLKKGYSRYADTRYNSIYIDSK